MSVRRQRTKYQKQTVKLIESFFAPVNEEALRRMADQRKRYRNHSVEVGSYFEWLNSVGEKEARLPVPIDSHMLEAGDTAVVRVRYNSLCRGKLGPVVKEWMSQSQLRQFLRESDVDLGALLDWLEEKGLVYKWGGDNMHVGLPYDHTKQPINFHTSIFIDVPPYEGYEDPQRKLEKMVSRVVRLLKDTFNGLAEDGHDISDSDLWGMVPDYADVHGNDREAAIYFLDSHPRAQNEMLAVAWGRKWTVDYKMILYWNGIRQFERRTQNRVGQMQERIRKQTKKGKQ